MVDREDVHVRRRLVHGCPDGTHLPSPAGHGPKPGAARASAEVVVVGDDREDAARAHRLVNGRPAGALLVVKMVPLLVLVMSEGPCVHMSEDGNGCVWTKMV